MKLLILSALLAACLVPGHVAAQPEPLGAQDTGELDEIEAPVEVVEPSPGPRSERLAGPGVEEITVTARKREESLQAVPAAVSAFSGDQLDAAGITQMQDLAFDVPNLHFGQENGSARITIRGISTGTGSDQSTAFHLNGIYQNDGAVATALTFFDVKRVDVLRGPQGTIYGRNATGGAINVISNPPSNDFELFGDVQIGNYHQVLARAVVNLPIVDDRAAFRMSGFTEQRDGYQINEFFNDRSLNADDAEDAGVLAQLLLSPHDDIDLTLRFNWFQKNGVGFGLKKVGPHQPFVQFTPTVALPIFVGAAPNPIDPRRVVEDQRGSLDSRRLGGNLDFRWYVEDVPLLGDMQWVVLGSFQDRQSRAVSDQDNSDLPTVISDITQPRKDWVAETRLVSQNDGDLDWVVGLFHLGSEQEQLILAPSNVQVRVVPPPPIIAMLEIRQAFSSRDYGFAAYGNFEWRFLDDFKLNAGLRYSHDWKRSLFIHEPAFLPPIIPPIFVGIIEDKSDNWGRVSGTLGVDWQYTDENLVYASFSTGYKAGTIEHAAQVALARPVPANNTTPEDIFAFEIGSKNDFWDNRVRFNATFFAYYYRDLQVSQLFQSVVRRENAASSRVLGIELELFSRPWRELTFSGNVSFLDARFIDFTGCTPAENPAADLDCSGNVMPRAPMWSGTVAVDYTFDLRRFGTFTPRAQVYFSDEVFFRAFNFPVDRQDAYAYLGFRALWRSDDGHLLVEAFVENALDTDVATTILVGSQLIGAPLQKAYDRPRTAGIRFGIEF